MRRLWRRERWVYALLILCIGLFFMPIYWAMRLT